MNTNQTHFRHGNIFAANISKIKKSVLPNINFILNLISENGVSFV